MTTHEATVVVNEIDLDRLDDAWESLVSAGIALVQSEDVNNWQLGDLVRKVEKKHGASSIKAFANAIGRKPSVVYDYHNVAVFFPDDDMREQFQALTWSHYREVQRLDDKVLDEYDVAMDLLGKAQDLNWTVETLKDEVNRLLKKPPTKKKFFAADAQIVEVKHAEHGMVHVTFEVAQDTDLDIFRERMGEMVTLKVYGEPKKDEADAAAQ